MIERIKKVKALAVIPMKSDAETRRVEIIILKFHEEPAVIDECLHRIVHGTKWPFRLTVYDNRMNTANTSRIWNKLIRESPCDYVCLVDSDVFVPQVEPCWLTRMMESIDETGVVVALGDNVGGSNKSTHAEPYPSSVRPAGIWSGQCALYAKSVFEKTGWFDERFHLYGQDSWFAHVCRKKIGGAVFRTDVLVQHKGSYSAKKADQEGQLDREAEKLYSNALFKRLMEGRE